MQARVHAQATLTIVGEKDLVERVVGDDSTDGQDRVMVWSSVELDVDVAVAVGLAVFLPRRCLLLFLPSDLCALRVRVRVRLRERIDRGDCDQRVVRRRVPRVVDSDDGQSAVGARLR